MTNGGKEIVEAISADHPRSKRSRFMDRRTLHAGDPAAARRPGSAVQAMVERTTGIVMPDADLDQTIADIVGAGATSPPHWLHGAARHRPGR